MRFEQLTVGEAFTLEESGSCWARILRKNGDGGALDDGGALVEILSERRVRRLETVHLTHAMWVCHEGEWRLVLRWKTPGQKEPQWTSVDPSASPALVAEPTPTGDRRARALLASGLHSRGELAQALQIYDELIDEREEASLLNNRGAARAARGDLENAIVDYTRALALDTGLAQAYSNRGNALTKIGRYEDAIVDYDRAIELAGDVAPIYCNRGLTRKMVGDLDGSLEDFDLAVAVDSAFGPGYLARGGVRALTGDIEGAVTDLEQFLLLSPKAPQREQVRLAVRRLKAAVARTRRSD